MQITLREDNHKGLGLEKRLDRVEKTDLLVDRITAGFRDIKQEENASIKMSQGSDSLHLNCVAFVKGMVQNSGRVKHLPASVFVIAVTNKQILSGESIRLHINVGLGDIVDEGRLADIGETGDDQSARGCVNLGQTRQVLSDLLKITQTGLEFFKQSSSSTEGRSLQHFGSVKTVGVFKQSNVIVSNVICDGLGFVHVTEGQLVMISIVEHIHEISVEGMHVVKFGERINDGLQFLGDGGLHELDLAHVELANTLNLETGRDHGRCLTLGFRERNFH